MKTHLFDAKETPTTMTDLAYRQFREITSKYEPIMPPRNTANGVRPYQARIVLQNKALEESGMITIANEIACGLGKTHIAALLAKPYVATGSTVIYISPSPTALGDYSHGNISIFYGMFGDAAAEMNYDGLLKKIYFFTPRKFISLSQEPYFQTFKARVGLVFLDEVHRFPDDPESTTAIIGKIKDILAREMAGTQTYSITATHIRNDGLTPATKPFPDVRYTLSQAIGEGWAPDIFGLPVIVSSKIKGITPAGDNLRLDLTPYELKKMYSDITGNVQKITRDYPSEAHCFFVRTIADAHTLTEALNDRFGRKTFGCLVSGMPLQKRQDIIMAVKEGNLDGYVTVNVGAESIDIERLSFCHLIVKTTSMIRLVQIIGRTTRMHPGKKRAVVVDYLYQKERALKGALGLWDYAENQGSSKAKPHTYVGDSLFNATDCTGHGQGHAINAPDDKTLKYGQLEAWLLSHIKGIGQPPSPEEVTAKLSLFASHPQKRDAP